MPGITIPVDAAAFGPGTLYRAILGSTLPTNTVAGGVFTDAWGAAWIPLGATKEGHTFSVSTNTENAEVAEYFDPIAKRTVGRVIEISFALVQIKASSYTAALNGGTTTLVSGTGATTLTKYVPPKPGQEIRCMIGWESEDNTERRIIRQCFQGGQMEEARRKGADYATLPVTFTVEQPSSGADPYDHFFAGATRGA